VTGRALLVDAHTHLDRYGEEIDAALAEITRHRIFSIATSMNIPSYRHNAEIAGRCPFVLPIFGVHPWNATGYVEHLDDLAGPIERSPMLGEVGLDRYFVKQASRFPDQHRIFEVFVRAAAEQNKVLNLHTTGAEREVLDCLDRYHIERAIIHWYSGPLEILDEMIARGYYFTVGIELGLSAKIQAIARRIPSDRLLTETDNPGGVKWLMGKVGMPVAIRDVIQAVAEATATTPQAVTETVWSNLRRLVKDDPWLSDGHRGLLAFSR
jgi:TatD DNase family protein